MILDALATIDTDTLTTVSGGASFDLDAQTRYGNVQSQFSTTARPDADKQLRCYSQVAGQAGWFQAPRETLRQQMELCGPLKQ